MEMFGQKWLWVLSLLLTFVGGLVHILQPLGVNILGWLSSLMGPGISMVVQFLAGVATILVVFKVMKWIE